MHKQQQQQQQQCPPDHSTIMQLGASASDLSAFAASVRGLLCAELALVQGRWSGKASIPRLGSLMLRYLRFVVQASPSEACI